MKRKCTFCKKKLELNAKNFYKTERSAFNGFMYRCKKCDSKYEKIKKDPVKVATRLKTRYLVKKGKIIQGNCRDCGLCEVEGHHPDYTRAEFVIWLCKEHHKKEHKRLRILAS